LKASINREVATTVASSGIKSLREEIGIARVVLQEILNKCETAADMMLYHNQIDKSISTIERLVASCHKLELQLNVTMDKQAVLVIATQMIDAITSTINGLDDVTLSPSDKNDLISAISTSVLSVVAPEPREREPGASGSGTPGAQ
jgi:hypothetical protein